jgi:hypothetical protein
MSTKIKTTGNAPKPITTVREEFIGKEFSAAEGPRASLILIRWEDAATAVLPASEAADAIRYALVTPTEPVDPDVFLSCLGASYELPEDCGRLPLRARADAA